MSRTVKRSMFRKVLGKLCTKGLLKNLSDEQYLPIIFWLKAGYKLNLKNPTTFSEKLQWLKLNYRKPIMTDMVDKVEAKKYVADLIGDEYIIPTLGVWNSFDEIDFDKLPNRFVLKVTHDSTGLIICKDKQKLDKAAAREKIEKALKRQFYYVHREWPYKNVKPRIIAEAYMEDSQTAELRDYKFYSFNGKVRMALVVSNRQDARAKIHYDYFDEKFNSWPDVRAGTPRKAEELPSKPETWDQMIVLAEKLAGDFPFIRVDLYEVDGKNYFGELTFYPCAGYIPFSSIKWDEKLGSWLKLPIDK